MSLEENFQRRVQSALQTVRAWEDPSLLADCRATIPFAEIADDHGPYSDLEKDPEDITARYFQRLCRYFQKSMTWVNKPESPLGPHVPVQYVETRGAETEEEKQGGATRVEVYRCTQSQALVTFPRYNNPRKLLQTRSGRCGEYANLFGLYCRASGLATRYVLDFTDHVWTEVLIPRSETWSMGDGCEGVIQEPSMYEAGWGKKLSYVLAVATDQVLDVTPRYSRQWANDEFLARRRSVTTSEATGAAVLQRINSQHLWKDLGTKARQAIQERHDREERELSQLKQCTRWDDAAYAAGRISGATEWKLARGEAGARPHEDGNTTPTALSTQRLVESFLPATTTSSSSPLRTIVLSPQSIVVEGASCAMREPHKLATVVVDPPTGCILQSKALASLEDLQAFCETVPDGRLVLVRGQLSKADDNEKKNDEKPNVTVRRLPQFDSKRVYEKGIVYAGQVGGSAADWTLCQDLSGSTPPTSLTFPAHPVGPLGLKTWKGIRPSRVVGRLPESVMPLATQLLSNFVQKEKAFLSLVSDDESTGITGYCTKDGAPIYLLGPSSYPLEPCDNKDSSSSWVTFLRLPTELIPDSDKGACLLDAASASKQQQQNPLLAYEVPVDSGVFVNQVGPQLLRQSETLDTGAALRNARLIAFYFSAHWCGPCRSFTPMLAEMYEFLKEEFPSHGLEIVFVSSDRDQGSFNSYYRTMPWLAIPFPALAMYKELLSFKFSVQGIPSLIIMDALTGAVVSDARSSRQEVIQAGRRGESAILEQFDSWLKRVPAESREILEMLQVSCTITSDKKGDDDNNNATEQDPKVKAFLTRTQPTADQAKQEMAARIKARFEQLTKEGMSPNEAAAKAIADATSEAATTTTLQVTTSTTITTATPANRHSFVTSSSPAQRQAVLGTATKYLTNVQREPWNAKFRSIKLSNKVADRITSIPGALEFLGSMGLDVCYSTGVDDFCATVPPGLDLDVLLGTLRETLQ